MSLSKHINLSVCATKMSDDRHKSYQTTTFNKIVQIINALFNGKYGGILRVLFDTPSSPKGHIKESVRKIEQKVCDFTGVVTLVYDLTIVKKSGFMEIIVAESDTNCIYTLSYNLYLPTNQQVIEVSPKDPVKKVRDILCMNIPSLEAVKPGSHFKEFTLGVPVSFGESKTVQFKQLLVKRTKNINLAQRLIKNGKFLCYVSAFANYSAGHIYIGIDDDSIVQGETITPEDQTQLKKEISKAIHNMIWPDNSHTQGGEEKRWQIDFEAVKYKSGEIVPSTFVIVIYVAQCPGGVFTKQPESYEIKENEAKMIDFLTWKKIIVEGSVKGRDEIGKETSEATYEADVDKMLTELLNDNCEWSDLKKAAENAQTSHDGVDVRLICLSKLIKFCLRKGDYEKADEMFEKYKTILPQSSTLEVFEIMEQYLHCLKERSLGNYEASYEIAKNSLKKLDEIHPGIVSAAFFVLIATVVNIIAMKKENQGERSPFVTKAKEFYRKAENHLQYVSHEFEAAKADLRQKIYMNETMLFSGSSLEGIMLPDSDASVINKAEAQNCLDKSQHIVTHEMFPLNELRDIQHLLAQSDLFYRAGKSDKTVHDFRLHALKFAKRAEHSANDAGLPEMKLYAQNRVKAILNEI